MGDEPRLSRVYWALEGFTSAYLVVRDGRLSVVGQLHQRAQVRAQV